MKYLYIDDNSVEIGKGIVAGLNKANELTIDFDNPKGSWEAERVRFSSRSFADYDGLILDLNLEETPNKEHVISRYKGSSLAQEIRNLSKANEIQELPIILLSATVNLTKFFDKTNEDLFDLIIERDSIGKHYAKTTAQLIALGHGYKRIRAWQKDEISLEDLLGVIIKPLDSRFVAEILALKESPTHTLANFLLKHFITRGGILIKEKVLASRLGVDIKSDGWRLVVKQLEPYKYSGTFSEGWNRWWMHGIEDWWRNVLKVEGALRNLPAEARVDAMSKILQVDSLSAATKSDKARSSSFWTVCIGSKVPIDTIDGLLVAGQDNAYPWQDKSYISVDEGLKPTNRVKWNQVASIESQKLEQLKKLYPNARPAR